MLVSLHVKNLALIKETEVNFRDGLNILSGETGAGKSLIIDSINADTLAGNYTLERLCTSPTEWMNASLRLLIKFFLFYQD